MPDLFSVPAFFVLFRETTEASILISVLLAFCKQVFGDDPVLYRRLKKQVWAGTGVGLLLVSCIAAVVVVLLAKFENDVWSDKELLWEGILALIASITVTAVGITMLKSSRISHQDKWRLKVMNEFDRHRVQGQRDAEVTEGSDVSDSEAGTSLLHRLAPRAARAFASEKYALFFLPFITILREGIETVVFVAGVGLSDDPRSLPLACIVGFAVGAGLGLAIFFGGNKLKLKYFFIASTSCLLVVAAGLFTRGIRAIETKQWLDSLIYPPGAGDDGPAPMARYTTSLWWLLFDPKQSGWSILNACTGFSNIGTPASVVGYCLYWVAVMVWLFSIKAVERKREKEEVLVEVSPGEAEPLLG
ncbi:hypothetical protein HKX48_006434 [Thoreauomyces humboldtii]|nr:hypothetical protein HKX48_006434 [Thoreauomyces humboldtii]